MKKFEHLTAAEARAIPIEDSLIKDTLEEIYGKIRKAAAWGQLNIYFSFYLFSDRVREELIRQLKDDGYCVRNIPGLTWEISWREE